MIELLKKLSWYLCISANVSADSGKVELVFEKTTPDIQWASVGKHLDQHNTYIQYDEYSMYSIVRPQFPKVFTVNL